MRLTIDNNNNKDRNEKIMAYVVMIGQEGGGGNYLSLPLFFRLVYVAVVHKIAGLYNWS